MSMKTLFHMLSLLGLIVIVIGWLAVHQALIIGLGMVLVAVSLIPGMLTRRRSR